MKPGLSVHFMVKRPEMDRFAEKVAFMSQVADEIVIVDTGSSESDKELMRTWDGFLGTEVRVHETQFVDFATTRNEGLKLHTRQWTFGMDWDELPSMALMHVLDAVAHRGYRDKTEEYKKAVGFLVLTHAWWAGQKGPQGESDWHIRLWLTGKGELYRPVHELVRLNGKAEYQTRNTPQCPKLPAHNYLIHSKGFEEMVRADQMYAEMQRG